MPPLAAFAIAAAPVAAAGVGIYTAIQSTREAKKVREAAERRAGQEYEYMEKQAGEYYQLSTQQMELQSQASQIKTLANLITARRQPAVPQVLTLPPAKEYSAVDRINQAIGDLLKG